MDRNDVFFNKNASWSVQLTLNMALGVCSAGFRLGRGLIKNNLFHILIT
jgi:hypothetical protein